LYLTSLYIPCDHAKDKIQVSRYSKITDFASDFLPKLAKFGVLRDVSEGDILGAVNSENENIQIVVLSLFFIKQ
jgi:hypothetical protein